MKFQLSESDYRELIRLAYLGEWLINAPHDPEHQDESASLALQRLLAIGKDLRGIEQDAETQEYYLEAELADKLYDNHISDYDDHVFWDELSERLAARDLAARRGVAAEAIDREEDLAELKPIEDHYLVEFERHGIERLDISE